MKATEAKALSVKNLQGVVIEPFLNEAFAGIKANAEKGRTDWYIKFTTWPSTEERNAVYNKLRELGYTVTFHDDPDPGHPCSTGSYETLGW